MKKKTPFMAVGSLLVGIGIIISILSPLTQSLAFTEETTGTPAGWADDTRLTFNTTGADDGQNIAVYQNYIHILHRNIWSGQNEIYYINSIDGGTTWNQRTRLSPGDPVDCTKPDIGINKSQIHLVWNENDGTGREIVYRNSTDSGITWNSPKIISKDDSFNSEGPKIAVSEDTQNIHVIWVDSRHGAESVPANTEIYYNRSLDGGITWEGEQRLTNAWYASAPSGIALNGSNIHVTWVDERNGYWEIYYKMSKDNGVTWQDGQENVGLDRCLTTNTTDHISSSLAVNGSTIHVVWVDQEPGPIFSIYYRNSTDNGATWGSIQQLVSPFAGTAYAPNLAVQNDTVHMTWHDMRDGGQPEIYYKNSTDNGATWSPDLRLTGLDGFSSGGSKIALSGSQRHIIWGDQRDGNPEIYYKRYPEILPDIEAPEINHAPVASANIGQTINITANITDDIGVDAVYLNYTGVNGTNYNVSMTRWNGNWSYDIPGQNNIGTVNYFIWCNDTTGNTNMTGLNQIQINDVTDPEINHISVISSNVGDVINITANITDNVGIDAVYLNYTGVNGTNYNVSMNRWSGNYSFDIPGQNTTGFVSYFIWANDTTGNTEITPVYQIQILDVTKPEIVHNPVTSGTTGEPINVTAKVTDDVAVDRVFLNYTDVLGANYNISMNGWNGNNWSYIISGQNPNEQVDYFIWANDTSGNANMTGEYQIQISDNDNPIADAGSEQAVKEDEMVQFDGSGSTDNGGIAWYNWTFGDGGYDFGSNVTPNHTYTNAGTYIATLNVSDAAGNWATDTCFVFVSNVAPIANAGIDKTVNEGVLTTFDGSASNDTASDKPTLTYVWYFGDGNSQAGKIVSHAYADNDIYNVTLVVTDDNGRVDSDICNVTVNNVAPAIIQVANHTAQQGVSFTLKINATDVSADILTFSDNTTLFDINPVTGIIQFTPTYADVGNHFVNVTVTDDDLGSSSITFKITVNNTKDAPVIAPIPAQSATEDAVFTLQVMASDSDVGDTLTHSLTAYPVGMNINSTTGLISWTPTNAAVGSHAVTVRVSDAVGLYDERTFVVTVANVNDAPTISTSSLANATEDAMYLYPVLASDVDVGDTLTYSLDSAPTFLSINPGNGLLYGTPTNAHVGTHQVIVNVSDGTVYITRSFNLTVLNMNDPPTLNYVPPQAITEDVPFGLQLVGQDVDVGETITYSLISSPSSMSINQITGLIAWTPTNNDLGSHTVIVRVSDASGAFAERSFQITVTNVNDAPTITTTSLPNATEGIMYLATIQAEDVDGDVLMYSFDASPSFLSINAETGLIYGMPTNNDVGIHLVIVNVSDGTTFVTRAFNLTVLNVNELPTIASYPITITKPGSEYAYAVIAEDADAGIVLTYSLVEAPEGMAIDDQTGKITWTPTEAQAGQIYQVVVQVSDGNGSTTQTFSIVVDDLPAEPYHPLLDDYVWIGIIILLIAIIMFLAYYMFNMGKKEEEPVEEKQK